MPARFLLLLRPGSDMSAAGLGDLTPGVWSALQKLESTGIAEEDLDTLARESDGPAGLPLLQFALHSLSRQGLLSYCAQGGAGMLAVTWSTAAFELPLRTIRAETRYVFSRFAMIRRVEGRVVVESSRSPARIVIHDERVVALVTRAITPCSLTAACCELSEEEVTVLSSLFLGCNVFEPVDDGGRTCEDEDALAFWSFHDLLFHSRTRLGRHLGGYGATYPFRGRGGSPPGAKSAMWGERLELDAPDLERLLREDVPFTVVLEGRRTRRRFGDPPLHRRQLGEFLYRVARQRGTFDDSVGMQPGGRPYPGGGAVYELEIYLSVGLCVDLCAGFYHYRPGEHWLTRLPARPDLVSSMLRRSIQTPEMLPQVLLTIAARFPRVFWKYESMGYALVLKDAGVLMQTMYLVAEAMGLSACALGGGDADVFADASRLDAYAESSVGEFLIGSRAEGDA